MHMHHFQFVKLQSSFNVVDRWKITILENCYPGAWTKNILLNSFLKTKNRVWVWCTCMQAVFPSHYNSQLDEITISLITVLHHTQKPLFIMEVSGNVQVSTSVAKLFHLFYFLEHSKKPEPKSFIAKLHMLKYDQIRLIMLG